MKNHISNNLICLNARVLIDSYIEFKNNCLILIFIFKICIGSKLSIGYQKAPEPVTSVKPEMTGFSDNHGANACNGKSFE